MARPTRESTLEERDFTNKGCEAKGGGDECCTACADVVTWTVEYRGRVAVTVTVLFHQASFRLPFQLGETKRRLVQAWTKALQDFQVAQHGSLA